MRPLADDALLGLGRRPEGAAAEASLFNTAGDSAMGDASGPTPGSGADAAGNSSIAAYGSSTGAADSARNSSQPRGLGNASLPRRAVAPLDPHSVPTSPGNAQHGAGPLQQTEAAAVAARHAGSSPRGSGANSGPSISAGGGADGAHSTTVAFGSGAFGHAGSGGAAAGNAGHSSSRRSSGAGHAPSIPQELRSAGFLGAEREAALHATLQEAGVGMDEFATAWRTLWGGGAGGTGSGGGRRDYFDDLMSDLRELWDDAVRSRAAAAAAAPVPTAAPIAPAAAAPAARVRGYDGNSGSISGGGGPGGDSDGRERRLEAGLIGEASAASAASAAHAEGRGGPGKDDSAAGSDTDSAAGGGCGGGGGMWTEGMCCICLAERAVVGFVHTDVVHCCLCGGCREELQRRGRLGACPICKRPAVKVLRVVAT